MYKVALKYCHASVNGHSDINCVHIVQTHTSLQTLLQTTKRKDIWGILPIKQSL